MAAVTVSDSERLFSLELLVDWVHLEARLLPPEDQEEAEPLPSSFLRLAVAFRLLDFPTLLVYPPGGPVALSRGSRPGSFPFGRGKSCLFRLGAATLQRLLGFSPLYALLLTVPPGNPTPAPKLLGSCSISLAPAARGLIGGEANGLSTTGASQGHRGLYILRDLMGEQIGQIYLGYRLTDLGSTLLGHIPPKTPVTLQREGESNAAGALVSRVEEMRTNESVSPAPQEKQPSPPPFISFAQVEPEDLEDLEEPKPQDDVIEIVTCDKTKPKQQEYVIKIVKTPSKCKRSDKDLELTDSSQSEIMGLNEVRENINATNQEVTELELETNIICPPPLYYSHLEPKKVPPAKGRFITVPQISVPKESDDVVQEEIAPCPMVRNHEVPSDQNQTSMAQSHPDRGEFFDQDKLDTIRQLPLLNALLVELSLLYNQPLATATGIHPHLAWLYRPEDGKAPEPSKNATGKTEEVGDKFLPREKEKDLNPQLTSNQVEHSLKKEVCFEKKHSIPKKVVQKRKLFYGLTNTLKLRLKRTNPAMLILHEKREQYRKMQTEMPETEKLRLPSSKEKSYTEEHGEPNTLPSNLCSTSDVLAENIKSLKQNEVESEGQSFTKETDVSETGTEKEINIEVKINKEPAIEKDNVISPILTKKVTPTSVSELFEKEVKVCHLDIGSEHSRKDNIVDYSNGASDRQVETVGSDFHSLDSDDNKSSKNSYSESVLEVKYSEDFTSPCYSEDFSSVDDTIGSSRIHDSMPELEANNLSYSYLDTDGKSSESRTSRKSHKSEINSILTPPFSAGLPVHSYKKSHLSKSQGKSLVDASNISSSDISSHWSERKKKQNDQNSIHNSEMSSQGIVDKSNPRTGQKSLEKSQSLRTSQVSSYLPSNVSELELSALDSFTSDQFEENDELGSLNICNQYKDICELVINKLPGYTV
ncbi:microtubule-associated protein 10 [Monodelphis domestica]|uniref:microtubule-associated protein 10 n=1 Tax=Monodelphis domestica TaxID=13616 RepID=UPI0000F2BCD5|nr:microtubule-associated protein 10 [Monodelphis domestica]